MSIYFYYKGNTPVGMNNGYEVGALNYPFNYPKSHQSLFLLYFLISHLPFHYKLVSSFLFYIISGRRVSRGVPRPLHNFKYSL